MARPYVIITDSFKEFKDKVNTVSYNVGDPVNLTTTGDSDVVQAINEIDSDIHGAGGGNVKADLNYTAYQETVASGTVVGSINAISSFIGDSANTLDVEASTLVGAINEIEAVFDASATEITSPSSFENYITGSWLVDASQDVTLDAGSSTMYWKHNGVTRFVYNLGTTNEIDVAGNLVWDVSGDITFDADNGNIRFKDGGTEFARFEQHNNNLDLFSGDSAAIRFTGKDQLWYGDISKQSSLTFDITGDIITDVSGGDALYKVNGTTRLQHTFGTTNTTAYTGNLLQTSSGTTEHTAVGDYTIDVTGDIIFEADGEQIKLRKGTTDRFTFNTDATPQLDINGNYTQAITGFQYNTTSTYMKDSATTNYYLNANSGITQWTGGGYNLTSGTSTVNTAGHTHTASSNVQFNVAGDYTIDASGDVILDVDGDDIFFKQAGTTKVKWTLGTTNTAAVTGGLTFDVSGDIILDADGNDITLRDGANDRVKFTLGNTNTVDVTGALVVDVDSDATITTTNNLFLDADSDVYIQKGGVTKVAVKTGTDQTVEVTGALLVDADSDITLEANGGQVNLSDGTANRVVVNLGTNQEIDVAGNLTLDVAGDVIVDADDGNVTFKDGGTTQFDFIAGTNKEIDVPSGNLTLDVAGNVILDADGGNWELNDAGTNQFKFIGGTNKELDVPSGNLLVDVAGDITLDAGGTQVNLADGTANRIVYNLGANQEIDYTGTLTMDIGTDLNIDVDGGDIYLKDAGTQFGRFQQANTNQLTIYSSTTAALTFTSNTATINNRALFTDSALSTTVGNVAGGINELKGRADSADGKIQSVIDDYIGGNGLALNTLMSFFDSAGTKDNVIAALNHLGKFAVKVYDESGNVLTN